MSVDDKVETLRILAFNKTSRICESNTFYYGDVLGGNTLRHPINKGEYDFVFLANEPHNTIVKAVLDNITDYDAYLFMALFDKEVVACHPWLVEASGRTL